MGCCCSKNDFSSSEDPEEKFVPPEGLPDPGPPPPPPEDPLSAPPHVSIYHNDENQLEGKDILEEIELSPVSEHID